MRTILSCEVRSGPRGSSYTHEMANRATARHVVISGSCPLNW